MPHYEDGTEAKLGDVIHGKPYNTPHEVIGVVVGITPAQESCNLRVAFARKANGQDELHGATAFGDGATAPLVTVTLAKDYGETKDFRLVYRGS